MRNVSIIMSIFLAIISISSHGTHTFPTVIEWKIAEEIPEEIIRDITELVNNGASANEYRLHWEHRGIIVLEHDFTRAAKFNLLDLGTIEEINKMSPISKDPH